MSTVFVSNVYDSAALLVTAGGLLAAALVLLRAGVATALAVLLDMLTAAGLLRLVATPTPARLASAALIIAIRAIAGAGIRSTHPAHVRRAAASEQPI